MNTGLQTIRCAAMSNFLIAEAWWELLRAKVLAHVTSGRAKRLRNALRAGSGRNDRSTIEAVAAAVERASRYHLRPMRCLDRSLALLWMLRRRGIATALRLGCRRNGEALDFHAWVVDGDARILENSRMGWAPLHWPGVRNQESGVSIERGE